MVNRIWRPVTEKAKQLTGPNLYPVRSVTTCDGDLCGEKDCKFLLRHRLWSLSVRSLYLLDGLLKQDESLYLQPRVSHDLIQNHKSGDEHTHTHTHTHTIFLKLAHVLLLEVLCSRTAVLLISSPTLSLQKTNRVLSSCFSSVAWGKWLNITTPLKCFLFHTLHTLPWQDIPSQNNGQTWRMIHLKKIYICF